MLWNLWTLIFLATTFAYVITLLWLNLRQDKAVIRSFSKVPDEFVEKISLDAHQKAARYTQAKLLVNHFEVIFAVIVLMIWTLGGGMDWLDGLWRGVFSDIDYIGVGFIISILLIGGLIDLPFSLYRTFKLEAKFGFNKATFGTFWQDMAKELGLSLVIGLPLIYAILYLMGAAGELWWLGVWLLISGLSVLMLWIYPAFIAPIFNKFSELDDKNLKAKIVNLLERTGFKSDGVFVMDGSKRSTHGNAYLSGIGKNKRIVFFDTLLKGMNDDEVEAILAHELGHFRLKHIQKQLLSSFLISLIGLALLGFLITQPWFFNGLGVATPSNHTALVLFVLVAPIFSFFISPLLNYLSRKFEFEADAFAAKHANPQNLISALVKLYKENASTLTPDSLYTTFHNSHPPATERINQLQST